MKNICLILLMSLSLTACKDDATTPEGLLKQFVIDSTTKKLDKEYFDKYTTGNLKESFDYFFEENEKNKELLEKLGTSLANVKDPKVIISKKNCTNNDTKCSLTYVVKYDYHIKKAKEFKTEVKKLATVVKDGDIWKISEVSNLKTYHEATNPINVQ